MSSCKNLLSRLPCLRLLMLLTGALFGLATFLIFVLIHRWRTDDIDDATMASIASAIFIWTGLAINAYSIRHNDQWRRHEALWSTVQSWADDEDFRFVALIVNQ